MFSYSKYYLGIIRRYSAKQPADLDILDYGCGAGWLCTALRQEGCAALGYDLVNRLEAEAADHPEWYAFFYPERTATDSFVIDWSAYRLPYPDNSFDVIITSQVVEHMMQLEPVFAEFARVLRPDGVAINTFPARMRLMEPHVKIPLAHHLRSRSYYRFMDKLGVRRPKFAHMSVEARLDTIETILNNQVIYRPTPQILECARTFFHRADMDYAAYCRQEFSSELSRLWHVARCNLFKSVMMVAQYKK